MRKLVIALFTLFMLVACGGSPDGMIESYYTNLDQGEITKASEQMSQVFKDQVGANKIKSMLTKQAKNIQSKGGIDSVTVEGEAKGEIGQFTAHIVYGDGSKKDDKINVVKEDDGWKISPR